MAELLIPNQRVAGSIPVRVNFFFHFLRNVLVFHFSWLFLIFRRHG